MKYLILKSKAGVNAMIPIRDQIKPRRAPVVNTLLIIINILVFGYQWLMTAEPSSTQIFQFAFIPANFLAAPTDPSNIRNIFTAMFMHAGFLHLAGNMLYLWIFGDNVEDVWGPLRYLVFYLVGGVAATFAHVITNPASVIPTVGASGAIAAVLGAYLVLYPQSRVLTFIPIGYFMTLKLLPASIVLGAWFILQLFSGVLSFGGPDVGGTAFWAHIGGFVTGVLLALLFGKRRQSAQQRRW
jgi:membrane associated rhomboid family serine protease